MAVAYLVLVRPMTKRYAVYIVAAINLVYIAVLVVCAFLIGPLRPPDFAALRDKIETSSSVEDLRPRALHIVSAIEAADRAIGRLHQFARRLIAFGVTLALLDLLSLLFLIPRKLRI